MNLNPDRHYTTKHLIIPVTINEGIAEGDEFEMVQEIAATALASGYRMPIDIRGVETSGPVYLEDLLG